MSARLLIVEDDAGLAMVVWLSRQTTPAIAPPLDEPLVPDA